MRDFILFDIEDTQKFKKQLLLWSESFKRTAFLDSNDTAEHLKSKFYFSTFDCIAGIGSIDEILTSKKGAFEKLKNFVEKKQDWLFGFMSYDLKNETENLSSNNLDNIKMPLLHFFQPKYVFAIREGKVQISYLENCCSRSKIEQIFVEITSTSVEKPPVKIKVPRVESRFEKEEFLETIRKIKLHIQRGDIYEANLCQEFYSQGAIIDPIKTYLRLSEISPTPYACFYQLDDKYLISASPERFIKKKGSKLISQPIKGTARRGKNKEEDNFLKQTLNNSQKERAENIMIVDLVRNDLSRTAQKESVQVEELCGIYSYEQVHQMVSTVSSQLKDEYHFIDAIKYAFPMGSMTGAPKIKAMQLIENYEKTKRGLYSGTVGYITPDGNFDFNVVIRSFLYNSTEKYLSFIVGGAITIGSDPEQEYNECLLKAGGMLKVLGRENISG